MTTHVRSRFGPSMMHRHGGVSSIDVDIDTTLRLPDGRQGVRLTVTDDGVADDGEQGTTMTWYHALGAPGA